MIKLFKKIPLKINLLNKINFIFFKLFFIKFLLLSKLIYSHELWIEPKKYLFEDDEFVIANIKVGQMFEGINLGYFPRNFVRFDFFSDNNLIPINGVIGDNPAINFLNKNHGIGIIIYQTNNEYLYYDNWNKFESFVIDKGLNNILNTHLKNRLPKDDFVEIYKRYSKSIIGFKNYKGRDKNFGMETEFVLQNNLLDNKKNNQKIKLFYKLEPRKNVQVEIFEKNEKNEVKLSKMFTDDFGVLNFTTKPGNTYLLNSVVMRRHEQNNINKDISPNKSKVLWESLWASITFKIPKK